MADFSICIKAAEAMKEAGESGILLTAGTEKANAMTIGWCTEGVMWGKPVICVPVRKSRYTHDILEKETAFTVYIPEKRNSEMVMYFGTVSGRQEDKLEKAGLETTMSDIVPAPMITAAGRVIHAEILFKTDISEANMAPDVIKWYADHDFHTLYFAEIKTITEN